MVKPIRKELNHNGRLTKTLHGSFNELNDPCEMLNLFIYSVNTYGDKKSQKEVSNLTCKQYMIRGEKVAIIEGRAFKSGNFIENLSSSSWDATIQLHPYSFRGRTRKLSFQNSNVNPQFTQSL